jgi:hypothetical protein
MPKNAALKVSVAYDIPRGDPLRNWNAIDFRIGDKDGELQPRGKGVRVKMRAGNCVLLQDVEENFRFSVSGFDQHRDLFVRVDELSNGEEETE